MPTHESIAGLGFYDDRMAVERFEGLEGLEGSMKLAPGSRLSHYVLGEKLGQGGMGVVFRAHDDTLRRDVALKVVRGDMVGDANMRARFLREARTAAAVTHPNIATIYEAGEADGELFLSMELIKGECLRARLRQGRIPIPAAVGLAGDVAEGLARAHGSKVVHRDLKPENIMIGEDGSAKILDFGLAKVLVEPAGPQASRGSEAETVSLELTRRGVTVGTPAYMSPEQARGADVDYRTDIFSLGITLFEMLTGKVPFRGNTIPETLSAVITEPTPVPSSMNPRIPPRLERLVLRCLQKDPEKRYQRTADLSAELREIKRDSIAWTTRILRVVRRNLSRAAVVVSLFVLAGAYGLNLLGIRDRAHALFAGQRVRSVAVLPLRNLSEDPEQDYFAAGITEALTNKLGQIGALDVVSRTSAMRFKDSTDSLPQIAAALGVDAILEGSILRVTNSVAVTVRLVEAESDRQLWSREYRQNIRDLLDLPNDVARELALGIRAQLSPATRRRLDRGDQVDPEAFDLYLRGRYVLAQGFSSKEVEEALRFFQQSIDLAPDFALAHAAVAEVYARMVSRFTPEESIQKGLDAARRAIELDDSLGVAYAALGRIKYLYEWDWSGAEGFLKSALEREPETISVLQSYAMYLHLVGRFEEGNELNRKAVALDPLTLSTQQQLALGYGWSRQWDRAFEGYDRLEELLQLNPNPTVEWGLHYQRALVYMFSGRYEEAHKEVEAAHLNQEAYWLAIMEGDRDKGYEALNWLDSLPLERRPTIHEAVVSALLGEIDRAFEALHRGYERGVPLVAWVNLFPPFDVLKSDPRWHDLLTSIGLPTNNVPGINS